MVFGYFTLVVAVLISAIAAYYSIVGLASLFAAALVPVIIMGAVLEIGKVTAALWLKLNWNKSPFTFKLYLVPAVAILMFLTSMGIFGFLSRAHLEQTSTGQESQAQIQRLDTEINRRTDIVKRAELKIKELESTGTGQDAQIQSQIDREQVRIDAALKRIEPAIQEQNDLIGSQNKIYQDQLLKIDQDLLRLQTNLDKNDIAAAQAQVGVQPDGRIGPRSQAAFKEYRDRLNLQKTEIISQIERSNNNPVVQNARREIQRIRTTAETQINESNQLINRLRSQLGKGPSTNIDTLIDEQQTRIKTANQDLEQFIEQKYKLESEFRRQEAELGPVKYIAELVYGDNPDKSLLESAVRFVIIIIVIVFDPLALVLILAAQQSIRWASDSKQHPQPKEDKLSDVTEEEIVKETSLEYLIKPWNHIGKLQPLVAEPSIKVLGNCSICQSELIDAGNIGALCSNVTCTSYNLNNTIVVDQDKEEFLTIKANSTQEISVIAEENATVEKITEAKRGFKAPSIKIPETLDLTKKLQPVPDNIVNTQQHDDNQSNEKT
jgi:hypothetical protein